MHVTPFFLLFMLVHAVFNLLQFEECLRRELGVAEKDKAAFIKEFSEADYNAIEAGWKVRAAFSCILALIH